MKTIFAMFAVLALTGGCASFTVANKGLHAAGTTTDIVPIIDASARADVDIYNAETYRMAVQNGYAYPYAGGGYGNDYSFHYSGIVPPQDGGAAPQGEVTREDIERVEGKADDSLKMHKKTREYLKAKEQK